MKMLKLHDRDAAIELTRLSDLSPFNDNGGEPDGNAWLIPLDECPQEIRDDIDRFGTVVEGEEVAYVYDEENEEYVEPEAEAWMGFTFDDRAYVVKG